jgi:hypothetical protein
MDGRASGRGGGDLYHLAAGRAAENNFGKRGCHNV